MTRVLTCPSCGNRLEIDERPVVRIVQCGVCRRPIPAPAAPGARHPQKSAALWLALGVSCFVLLLAVVGVGYYVHLRTARAAEDAKEDLARAQIRGKLVPAVVTYRLDQTINPTGELPPSLQDLLSDPKIGLKFDQLIDPWGKPFRYAGRTFHGAADGFDVWTVTPDGREIGNWGP